MSEHLFLLTICLILGTILLVFGMRAFSAIQQAKARLAYDDAYRLVAEKAATAETEAAAALVDIRSALTEVRTRLTAVEKILKDVE